MHKFLTILTGFLSFIMVAAAPANATVIETTFGTFPGGITFSSSGVGAATGVRTWNLPATDPSQFDQAWFTFDPIASGMDGRTSPLSLASGLGTSTAVWTGLGNWHRFDGIHAIETRFTAFISTGQNWIDPSTIGLIGVGSPQTVAEMGGPFTVNFSFEARLASGGAWMSHLALYDSVNNCGPSCSGDAITSASTRYFHTELPAVPVPAGLPLMAGGLALFGFVGMRRKRMS
ncbi:VPLPA-CTERM sorting domain-containing protein [Aestuariibius sp. HNIBRBA575]|uniref:VPLPA-CTERM sorting domain-containing protein n=1 Tax=Aestuariibius sp. HNIBRBA575 TaxID=3233343 RepID=UPI0034A3C9AE